MKRCPQCNRVEMDEALKFCRSDGVTLVSDSSSIGSDPGEAQLDSSVASEVETSILPHMTDHNIDLESARTTVLPAASAVSATVALKASRRKVLSAILVTAAITIVIAGYLYYSRSEEHTS